MAIIRQADVDSARIGCGSNGARPRGSHHRRQANPVDPVALQRKLISRINASASGCRKRSTAAKPMATASPCERRPRPWRSSAHVEIQRHARPRSRVGCNDVELDLRRLTRQPSDRLGVLAAPEALQARAQQPNPGEISACCAAISARWQRLPPARVDHCGEGLMKGTEQVRTKRRIDCRFAADGRIHRRQKGGWNGDPIHAAAAQRLRRNRRGLSSHRRRLRPPRARASTPSDQLRDQRLEALDPLLGLAAFDEVRRRQGRDAKHRSATHRLGRS